MGTMITRRAALSGAAVAAAAGSVGVSARPSQSATYVLVHGTWLGGWIWADVAERLRAAGHRVLTPTLTGVGERHHLTSPNVGLDTHIADVVNVIDFEELRDVILIGHSFSGVAVTGVADARRDRIRHIAFFDAVIPHAGRMTAVETNADGTQTAAFRRRRASFVDGYRMDFLADYPMRMLVDDTLPELQASVRRRLTTHPAKAWTDRLKLSHGGWEGLPRTCFRTTRQAFAPSSDKMWGPATGPGWSMVDVACGRMGMMTDPAVVADAFALLCLASPPLGEVAAR